MENKRFKTAIDRGEDHPGISFPEKGRTKQSFKDECDVNNIMRRYMAGGSLPQYVKADPMYGDFSNVVDYQTAVEIQQRAGEQFAALPSAVRARFENDPEKFLSFMGDKNNIQEMHDLGLLAQGVKYQDGKVVVDPPKAPEPAQTEPKAK